MLRVLVRHSTPLLVIRLPMLAPLSERVTAHVVRLMCLILMCSGMQLRVQPGLSSSCRYQNVAVFQRHGRSEFYMRMQTCVLSKCAATGFDPGLCESQSLLLDCSTSGSLLHAQLCSMLAVHRCSRVCGRQCNKRATRYTCAGRHLQSPALRSQSTHSSCCLSRCCDSPAACCQAPCACC